MGPKFDWQVNRCDHCNKSYYCLDCWVLGNTGVDIDPDIADYIALVSSNNKI